ncbi:uncharacterized protein EMH_0086120 [Eimeria mitis]|uniref:Uncharacterized protein n=1 Tax=Eimeria mitis TaxID=44415 RepID=U6JV28_9EIME|nr:uncharacterized protein EMH_0086120 [Eimeria mitis]CDJ27348.1 hypothetical protein, conserved [Eimeria mitis]
MVMEEAALSLWERLHAAGGDDEESEGPNAVTTVRQFRVYSPASPQELRRLERGYAAYLGWEAAAGTPLQLLQLGDRKRQTEDQQQQQQQQQQHEHQQQQQQHEHQQQQQQQHEHQQEQHH